MSNAEQPEKIHLPKTSESETLKKIRHTTSHVMAMAVQKLFPKVFVTIGPWIENGFYYDFDSPDAFTDKDLKTIQREMIKIVNQKLPVVRDEVTKAEAEARISALNEPYKLEILAGLQEPITLYHLGDKWWDLCAGPHLENTGDLNPKAFKLEAVAGAYWRGDETKAQLQRIYGTAWETPEQLAEYERRKEEALRRDHRKIGKELGLFIFSELVGPGLPLWTPKGTILRSTLEDFLKKEQTKRGYLPVVTPHIAKTDLFMKSGHRQKYKEDMFPIMADNLEDIASDTGFVMKPMNCPFHIQIYQSELRSYRDLPIRYAEFGTVYRYEQSGELGGLTRVRGFTVDDSHLFVTPEQLDEEFLNVVDLILSVFDKLRLKNFKARLSFRDPASDKYIGTDDAWNKAEGAITRAVEKLGMDHFIGIGEAAFYGPKLDFIFSDALDREWQLGTVQVDYILPERFELEYIDEHSSRQRPIMIHRAPFGSLERLIGILIEEYAGDFPLWMAPVQMRLVPVAQDFIPFAKEVCAKLLMLGVRAEVDTSNERLGKMVRNAEKEKIPVVGIIGGKEVEDNTISIRTRIGGELGAIGVDEVVKRVVDSIANFSDF
ncbi:threonine--tRNA ligase [Chamaesiphon sp.]|uniref:threonine--tRNA ligase n=1 Tax=Chamaesiphon sp. TaxID=2814140 RepID=UPI0035948A8B